MLLPMIVTTFVTSTPLFVAIILTFDDLSGENADIDCAEFINFILPFYAILILSGFSVTWKLRNRYDNIGAYSELKAVAALQILWILVVLILTNTFDITPEIDMIFHFTVPCCLIVAVVLGIPLYRSIKFSMREHDLRSESKSASSDVVDLLHDPEGFELFKAFLLSEFSAESCLFYKAVQNYHLEGNVREASEIYDLYVDDNAELCINISHKTRKTIRQRIESDSIDETLFDQAQNEVLRLMTYDSYCRFRNTESWRKYTESRECVE